MWLSKAKSINCCRFSNALPLFEHSCPLINMPSECWLPLRTHLRRRCHNLRISKGIDRFSLKIILTPRVSKIFMNTCESYVRKICLPPTCIHHVDCPSVIICLNHFRAPVYQCGCPSMQLFVNATVHQLMHLFMDVLVHVRQCMQRERRYSSTMQMVMRFPGLCQISSYSYCSCLSTHLTVKCTVLQSTSL